MWLLLWNSMRHCKRPLRYLRKRPLMDALRLVRRCLIIFYEFVWMFVYKVPHIYLIAIIIILDDIKIGIGRIETKNNTKNRPANPQHRRPVAKTLIPNKLDKILNRMLTLMLHLRAILHRAATRPPKSSRRDCLHDCTFLEV